MTEKDAIGALRSTAHPLRLRILSLLTPQAMSAAEVARELGVTHANASYHLRRLADAGELVVEGEEKIRGGVAKRYRHVWDGPRHTGGSLEPGDVDRVTQQVRAAASELLRRFDQREPGTPISFADAELWVTPEVWDDVRALLHRAAVLLHERAEPPRSEGTVPVNLTSATFRMRDDR